MLPWKGTVLLLVAISGCAAGCATGRATGQRSPAPGAELKISAIGRLTVRGGETLLCPFPGGVDCPGLPVVGLPANAGGNETPAGTAVRVEGFLKGATIRATRAPALVDQPLASLSPQRLCSTGSAVVADPAALATYLENETSYAGRWWDQSEASLVVAFTGNSPDRLEQVVRRGTGRVCVVASRYNLSQLSSGAEDIAALAPGWTKAGYVYGGAGVEVQRNRVVVRVAASDKQLREDLRVRFGDLVTLEQFLDLEVAPIRDIALSSADPAAAAASLQPLNATFTYHCGLDSTRSRTQSPANVSPPSASPASTEPNS